MILLTSLPFSFSLGPPGTHHKPKLLSTTNHSPSTTLHHNHHQNLTTDGDDQNGVTVTTSLPSITIQPAFNLSPNLHLSSLFIAIIVLPVSLLPLHLPFSFQQPSSHHLIILHPPALQHPYTHHLPLCPRKPFVLHQCFLQKLLEPSPPDPQLPSSSQPVKFTPLEEQVVELKAKHPDVLLMIEVGYKYRFFGQDAETAARVLGIYAHMNHNFLTASIPIVRLHVHVTRLVSAGYKVGVVKQTETASIKAHGLNRGGPFCRGLSALYTKATLEAAQDLGGGEDECGSVGNYMLCVVEKSILGERKSKSGVEGGFDVRIGIVGVEISTGDVVYGEFDDNFLRSELEAVVVSLSPAELLLGDPLSKQTEKLLLAFAGPSSSARVERASRDCLTDGGALAEVMTLYENMCVDSPSDSMQGNELTEHKSQQMEVKEAMNLPDLVVEALALTIRHLMGFGFERIRCSGALRPLASNTEMNLSPMHYYNWRFYKITAAGFPPQLNNDNTMVYEGGYNQSEISEAMCTHVLLHSQIIACIITITTAIWYFY